MCSWTGDGATDKEREKKDGEIMGQEVKKNEERRG